MSNSTIGTIVIVGVNVIYFAICWFFFKKEYSAYILRTYAVPSIIPIGIGVLGLFAGENIISVMLIIFIAFLLPMFVSNSLLYFIIKWIKKDEIHKQEFQEMMDGIARQKQQNAERIERENAVFENDDMREIKKIMAAIPDKINALNNFSYELQEKIKKLQGIAANAIANTYGEFSSGNNSIARYRELYHNYSQRIDPILSAQCDRIIKKIMDNINQKQSSINKNISDIQKYGQLQNQLQQEYNRELKIQKMKKINSQLSAEISDSEGDIAASIYNGYSVENAIKDFQQLNLAMDERRNYEIQYGQIEI